MKVVSIISFSISSAIVMLCAYLQSHLLIGLDESWDCWCCCLVENISKQNNNALREREATRRIKQRHVVNETESIGDVTFFSSMGTYHVKAPSRIKPSPCVVAVWNRGQHVKFRE